MWAIASAAALAAADGGLRLAYPGVRLLPSSPRLLNGEKKEALGAYIGAAVRRVNDARVRGRTGAVFTQADGLEAEARITKLSV